MNAGLRELAPVTLAFPRAAVAVELVIFTIIDAQLRILLTQRNEPPFQGHWALPGGWVHCGDSPNNQGEHLDAAARRELQAETDLDPSKVQTYTVYLW